MKICTKCTRELPDTEFPWRNNAKGQRIARCRECQGAASRDHYRRNKPMYLRKAKRWDAQQAEKVHQWFLDYFAQHPCVDCGEADPVVLEFDHVRGEKLGNVSDLRAASMKKIIAEVAKCDVVCANCHRRRTAKQFNWRKCTLP